MKTTQEILAAAKNAVPQLLTLTAEEKNSALLAMADALEQATAEILAANALDMEAARGHISEVMLDRLALTEGRIADMAKGIREVVALPDPVGRVIAENTLPNGLQVQRISVPMGVIAIIYESRPNVTSDAAALALKAGSALGTGGMATKLHAAHIATEGGVEMVIANGRDPAVLYDIVEGKPVGTHFKAKEAAR